MTDEECKIFHSIKFVNNCVASLARVVIIPDETIWSQLAIIMISNKRAMTSDWIWACFF